MILEQLLERRCGLDRRLEMVREELLGRYRDRDETERAIAGLEAEECSLVSELEMVDAFEGQLQMQTAGG